MAACPPLLDRNMQTLDERTQSLCDYAGKVLLVVNTASQCGFTPQYEGLEPPLAGELDTRNIACKPPSSRHSDGPSAAERKALLVPFPQPHLQGEGATRMILRREYIARSDVCPDSAQGSLALVPNLPFKGGFDESHR